MGKTHLLTRVLSPLAERDYQARWALLDLSYPFATVPDILSQACAQLGNHAFHAYYAAEHTWMNRSSVDVNGLATRLPVSNRAYHDEARSQSRYLTLHFLKGLSQLTDRPLLLLFDSLEKSSEEIQWWLMKNLLVSVSRLKHIRIVLAGRSFPEPDGSYLLLCLSLQLQPITQIDEYIAYCQQRHLTLSEEAIRALAHAFDYTPGLFVDVLPKFMAQKRTYG